MHRFYHGCMFKNAGGTNKIIGPNEKCLASTYKCFWKDPRDIKHYRVKTSHCTKNEPTVGKTDYDNYMYKRQRINFCILGTWQ